MRGVVFSHNIHIFSKTAKIDLSYRNLIMHLLNTTTSKLKIYGDIDMDIVWSICDAQRGKQLRNMASEKKDWQEIPKVLIIYDDVVGDAQLKSHQSELCGFSTMSRHSNIINVFLCQTYTSIPTVIRRNANLVVLMTCDNYPDTLVYENSIKNKTKEF